MPLPNIFRDSFVGQLIYYASGRRWCRYPEERDDFDIPKRYLLSDRQSDETRRSATRLDNERDGSPPLDMAQESSVGKEYLAARVDTEKVAENQGSESTAAPNPFVVEWYGPNDPECPLNWSFWKRALVTFQISWLTFAIYIGSSLFAPGILSISQKFGVSEVAASLVVTMFVIGYGIGPMFLSPLSEIPQMGRCMIYIITLAIFTVLQVPTALAKNLGALLPLRWLAGFIGSPVLATGGASLMDMFSPEYTAIVLGLWSIAAMAGPVLGPTLGGFAIQAKDWTWAAWILLWLTGGTLIFLALTMPETSSQAILYRRAVRLRRLTGNPLLKSQGEIDGEHMTMGDVAMMTLVRPFILGFKEPIVLSWNMYLALIYGLLYCWISSFDVVFIENHGFNLGENGLAFIAILIGVLLSYALFVPWIFSTLVLKFRAGTFAPEDRLPPAMVAALGLPISLFWFGWTSGGNIHWISPILASILWAASAFILFQSGFGYLVDCYPRYVASVLAGNDLFRSMLGAAFPLFSTAFFHNLGVGQACSVLGGVAIVMLPIPFVLTRYGPRIRSWSRYTGWSEVH